jgi:epoxyqueuosine reductase
VGRAGFARNVCVAKGNGLAGDKGPPLEAVAVLAEALSDPEPLVRGHAAWALGQVELPAAGEALVGAATSEVDSGVLEELEAVTPR